MGRYGAISSITFGQTSLAFPISVRVFRQAQAAPASGDSGRFATSMQLREHMIGVEVRTRDTATVEGLSLGQDGVLSIELAGTSSGQTGRTVTIDEAVLTGIDLYYEQTTPASVKLTFFAEAGDGETDPFSAEEAE